MFFERHETEHGCVTSCANGHGFFGLQAVGQMHKPIGFEPRFLRIAAEMALAHAPTIENDFVAGFEFGRRRAFHHAAEIYAGDHREFAYDR